MIGHATKRENLPAAPRDFIFLPTGHALVMALFVKDRFGSITSCDQMVYRTRELVRKVGEL